MSSEINRLKAEPNKTQITNKSNMHINWKMK